MTGSLRQIVYLSQAAGDCDDEEALKIARVAKELNGGSEVTGLLLFDGKRFIQAIEGAPDAVEATFLRIIKDTRHHHIEVASDRPVDRRQFGSWSMLARKTPAGACSPSFLRKVMELMRNVDNAPLQALFIGFTALGGPSKT